MSKKAEELKVGEFVYYNGEVLEIREIKKCEYFPRALEIFFTNGKNVAWMQQADVLVYKK